MNLDEAKEKFTQSWGTLGSNWGINRTMAQIHALLLVSPKPLSAEEIMEDLNISRGNANMNLRALIDWGLVQKELKTGERKEFFSAEKDVWEVARRVMAERKKREIEPVMKALDQLTEVEGDKNAPEMKEFKKTVDDIREFVGMINHFSERAIRSDRNWFLRTLMKIIK